MSKMEQYDLFAAIEPALPDGFRYAPNIVPGDLQRTLLEKMPEVCVVPAYLINMGRSLPKGEFIPVPFFCEIRLGAPLKIEGNRREITALLEAAVRELKDAAI